MEQWEAVSNSKYFLVFPADDYESRKMAESLLQAFIDAKKILEKLAQEKSTEVSPYYMLQDEAKTWLKENR